MMTVITVMTSTVMTSTVMTSTMMTSTVMTATSISTIVNIELDVSSSLVWSIVCIIMIRIVVIVVSVGSTATHVDVIAFTDNAACAENKAENNKSNNNPSDHFLFILFI